MEITHDSIIKRLSYVVLFLYISLKKQPPPAGLVNCSFTWSLALRKYCSIPSILAVWLAFWCQTFLTCPILKKVLAHTVGTLWQWSPEKNMASSVEMPEDDEVGLSVATLQGIQVPESCSKNHVSVSKKLAYSDTLCGVVLNEGCMLLWEPYWLDWYRLPPRMPAAVTFLLTLTFFRTWKAMMAWPWKSLAPKVRLITICDLDSFFQCSYIMSFLRLQVQCCHRLCTTSLLMKDDFKLNRDKFVTELNAKTSDRPVFLYNFLKRSYEQDGVSIPLIWRNYQRYHCQTGLARSLRTAGLQAGLTVVGLSLERPCVWMPLETWPVSPRRLCWNMCI